LKNQNDLIVAGAVILVCIGVSLAFFFQKREPAAPAPPTAIVTADAQPIPANVQYANELPGGGASPAGGAGGRGAFGGAAGGAAPAPGGMTPSIMGASPTG
jgi:hypothetical protein